MCFHGGGVSHKSTWNATDQFLMVCDMLDEEYAAGQQEKDKSLQESEVGCPPDEDCEPNELDGDLESMDNDSYRSNEEFDLDMPSVCPMTSQKRRMMERGILMRMERILTNSVLETCRQFDVLKWLMYIYHWPCFNMY